MISSAPGRAFAVHALWIFLSGIAFSLPHSCSAGSVGSGPRLATPPPLAGALAAEPVTPFPDRLPGAELDRDIPPRHAGPVSPDDSHDHQAVITELMTAPGDATGIYDALRSS